MTETGGTGAAEPVLAPNAAPALVVADANPPDASPTVEPAPTVKPAPPVEPAPTVDSASAAYQTPTIDPLIGLPQGGGRLMAASFDVLTTGRADLRRASLYIGIVLLLTVGPLAVLVLGLTIQGVDIVDLLSAQGRLVAFGTMPRDLATQIAATLELTLLLAAAGYTVVLVEGQTLAVLLLAGRLAGRRVPLRATLMRSRRVFWRIARAALIVGIPLELLQLAVQFPLTSGFSRPSQGASLFATAVGTVAGWPFVYLATGIVLGDVGAGEAVRRSVRLVRARPLTALAISIFAALAQYLIVFGIGAADDVVVRVVTTLGLNVNGGSLAIVSVGLLVLVLVVAFGTLQFTVTAITLAPQVIAFLALTRYTGGIDRALASEDQPRVALASDDQPIAPTGWTLPSSAPPSRFRWVQRRIVLSASIGTLLTAAAVARLAGS